MGQGGLLLDDVYVPSGDSAIGIYINAKIVLRDGLEGPRLTEICMASGNDLTGVYVTEKDVHAYHRRGQNLRKTRYSAVVAPRN